MKKDGRRANDNRPGFNQIYNSNFRIGGRKELEL